MPNQHKAYICQRQGCNRSFRRDKYLEHLKVCLGTFRAYSIGKIEGRNLTKTWRCSGFGCEAKFRTKKMCDRHTEKCEVDLHRPLEPLAGYPGEPGDEVEGPAQQESRFGDKILYIPIRVEYYDWLRDLEREAYEKQTGRTLTETEPKTKD